MIFAGTQGFLDDLSLENIADYETQLLPFMHQNYPDILREIHNEKKISDDLKERLISGLNEFKTKFKDSLNN